MVRVGLVGCGTIGSQLARAIQQQYSQTARLVALHDTSRPNALALQRRLKPRPPITSVSTLIRRSDLVLEAASADVVPPLLAQALRRHRDVFIMSVGGLLRDQTWRRLVRRSRGKLYIPSGALAGLDGVKALGIGTVRRAQLTTSKPPRALAHAPYVLRKRLALSRLRRPTVIFEGPPARVVREFPQNTNVAAALALSVGSGSVRRSRVRIRVVADPTIRMNIHELDVEGDCGRVRCRVESRPSANPKTSELAVRSAIATLERIFGSVSIGT